MHAHKVTDTTLNLLEAMPTRNQYVPTHRERGDGANREVGYLPPHALLIRVMRLGGNREGNHTPPERGDNIRMCTRCR